MNTSESLPPTLEIVPWPDGILERIGHDPRSLYVELFWLPTLGPSTTLLMRALVRALEGAMTAPPEPGGPIEGPHARLDLEQLAVGLGLGRHGVPTTLRRAIDRSVAFGLTRWRTPTCLAVHRRLPALSQRQVARLPAALAAAHRTLTGLEGEWPDQRARRLALSLFDLGEPRDATLRQLEEWRVPADAAAAAVAWAEAHGERARSPRPDPSSAHRPTLRRPGAGPHPAGSGAYTPTGRSAGSGGGEKPARSSSSVRTPNPVAPFWK